MTNDEANSLKAGLNSLRYSMKHEHDAVWQAGVHAIVEEMVLFAVGEAIQRTQLARERLFDALVPSLPPPQEQPPAALQSAPAPYRNGSGHYRDPNFDNDLSDIVEDGFPKFLHEEPQHYVGRNGE